MFDDFLELSFKC